MGGGDEHGVGHAGGQELIQIEEAMEIGVQLRARRLEPFRPDVADGGEGGAAHLAVEQVARVMAAHPPMPMMRCERRPWPGTLPLPSRIGQ